MKAVHVVGAGGIGCAAGLRPVGGRGGPSRSWRRTPAKVEAGRRDGVGVDGRPPLTAEFVPFEEWHPPADARRASAPSATTTPPCWTRLPPAAVLIPIQNGFDPRLAAHGHACEGIASFVSECEADRPHTRITRPGELHLGPEAAARRESRRGMHALGRARARGPVPRRGRAADRAVQARQAHVQRRDLAARRGRGDRQRASSSRCPPPAGSSSRCSRRTTASSPRPACARQGRPVPSRDGGVDPAAEVARRVMARRFEPSLRGTYCSMAGEIQKGRTEIDNYNGHLIRLAERHAKPCPLNRAAYDLVTRMTAERNASRARGAGRS